MKPGPTENGHIPVVDGQEVSGTLKNRDEHLAERWLMMMKVYVGYPKKQGIRGYFFRWWCEIRRKHVWRLILAPQNGESASGLPVPLLYQCWRCGELLWTEKVPAELMNWPCLPQTQLQAYKNSTSKK